MTNASPTHNLVACDAAHFEEFRTGDILNSFLLNHRLYCHQDRCREMNVQDVVDEAGRLISRIFTVRLAII